MIILILALSLVLRLISINQSFWLDEAITGTIARDLTFYQIINQYLPLDNSPPFYVLLINLLFSLTGPGEFAQRFLSVLFGVGTVFLAYLIGKEIKDKNFGLLGALLAATSPLLIYYSQEGRMYSLTVFLATAVFYFFIKFFKSLNPKYLLGYCLFAVVLIYTHYVPSLVLIAVNLLTFHFKKMTRWWIVTQAAIITAFLFWLPVFWKQLLLGISGRGKSEVFDEVLGKLSIKSIPVTLEKFVLGRIPVDINWTILPIGFAVLFFLFLAVVGFTKADKKLKKILGFWFFIPLFLAAIISLKIPVFQYYRILFLIIPFYFMVLLGAVYFKPKIRNVLLVLIILINMIGAGLYFISPGLQREQWKDAISYVLTRSGDNGKVLFASGEPFAPYLWYRKEHPEAEGAFPGFYVQDEGEAYFDKIIYGKKRLLVFTYLQDITDPQRRLQKWILKNGFSFKTRQSYVGVGDIETYER